MNQMSNETQGYYGNCSMCHNNGTDFTMYDTMYDMPQEQMNTMEFNMGGAAAPMTPMMPMMPALTARTSDDPETVTNPNYIPAYLLKNVGKIMRVEFLIGNQLTDRVGRLIEVGASYIVLQSFEPSTSIMCDLYSIKFVAIVNRDVPIIYPSLVV